MPTISTRTKTTIERVRYLGIAVLLLTLTCSLFVVETGGAERTQSDLPFRIKPEQLAETLIRFRVASTKPNSGWDEIAIGGDGKVILRAAAAGNQSPKELSGRVEPLVVRRLLQLLRAEGIEKWDDEYRAKSSDFVTKLLTIEVRNVPVKEVVMSQPEFAEFARAYGAIKLVAGLARREVLAGGFFQRI